MKMENKILKLLIVVCGLGLAMDAMAVNYNFSKQAGTVYRATPLTEFEVQNEMLQQVTVQRSNSIMLLSEQSSVAKGSSSLLNVSKQSNVAIVNQSEGGVSVSAFSSSGAVAMYDGFDATSVSMPATMSFSGPAKLPGDFEEPWPPVGEGVVALFTMVGLYVLRQRRKE